MGRHLTVSASPPVGRADLRRLRVAATAISASFTGMTNRASAQHTQLLTQLDTADAAWISLMWDAAGRHDLTLAAAIAAHRYVPETIVAELAQRNDAAIRVALLTNRAVDSDTLAALAATERRASVLADALLQMHDHERTGITQHPVWDAAMSTLTDRATTPVGLAETVLGWWTHLPADVATKVAGALMERDRDLLTYERRAALNQLLAHVAKNDVGDTLLLSTTRMDNLAALIDSVPPHTGAGCQHLLNVVDVALHAALHTRNPHPVAANAASLMKAMLYHHPTEAVVDQLDTIVTQHAAVLDRWRSDDLRQVIFTSRGRFVSDGTDSEYTTVLRKAQCGDRHAVVQIITAGNCPHDIAVTLVENIMPSDIRHHLHELSEPLLRHLTVRWPQIFFPEVLQFLPGNPAEETLSLLDEILASDHRLTVNMEVYAECLRIGGVAALERLPWDLVRDVLVTPGRHHAALIAERLNDAQLTRFAGRPDLFTLFGVLAEDYTGTTGALLDTVTSLA